MRVDGITIPLWLLFVAVLFAIYWFGFRGRKMGS